MASCGVKAPRLTVDHSATDTVTNFTTTAAFFQKNKVRGLVHCGFICPSATGGSPPIRSLSVTIRPFQVRHVAVFTSDYHARRSHAVASVVLGGSGIAHTLVELPSPQSPCASIASLWACNLTCCVVLCPACLPNTDTTQVTTRNSYPDLTVQHSLAQFLSLVPAAAAAERRTGCGARRPLSAVPAMSSELSSGCSVDSMAGSWGGSFTPSASQIECSFYALIDVFTRLPSRRTHLYCCRAERASFLMEGDCSIDLLLCRSPLKICGCTTLTNVGPPAGAMFSVYKPVARAPHQPAHGRRSRSVTVTAAHTYTS